MYRSQTFKAFAKSRSREFAPASGFVLIHGAGVEEISRALWMNHFVKTGPVDVDLMSALWRTPVGNTACTSVIGLCINSICEA
jgi:hypothetical protein